MENKEAREGQVYLCWLHDVMMIMMKSTEKNAANIL